MKHHVDVHVGQRIRRRRTEIGVSQENLGANLSLTFQQVQKYEKGANRVGASRLYAIAKILDVPIQYFFDDMPEYVVSKIPSGEVVHGSAAETDYVMDFVASREGLELNRAFSKIKDPAQRKALVELIKTLV